MTEGCNEKFDKEFKKWIFFDGRTKAIKENYKNITSIIITQRISSIINCDYIMMIDNGMVLGLGKHSELINSIDIPFVILDRKTGIDNQ